jgi:predicted dehydrogenase
MPDQSTASSAARPAPLRYGLIGCGDIGVVRAAALARTDSRLVAVSDIDPTKASGIGTQHGAAVDRDWHSLLARTDLDAVIVSTPPSLHAEMCIEALQAGKHVLCEKPLARTADECRSMVAAAETSGRVLATGFNYRFYPSFMLAREVLTSGRIGKLSHIRAYAGYSATGHNQPWVKDAAVVGGGALHDNGVHLIDLVRSFLGEVDEVQGFATGSVWNYGEAEDNGFLLMRSSQGPVATLHASWTEWGRYEFRVELVGTLGKIVATCFPMRAEVLWTDRVGGRTRSERHNFIGTMLGEHARSYRWVVARSFAREYEDFGRRVAGQPSNIASGMDGLRAIEIACAARHLGGAVEEAPKASTVHAR